MPNVKVTCAHCGRIAFVFGARRCGIALYLFQHGWQCSPETGRAVCSEDCRAAMARDVTPLTDEIGRGALPSASP